MLSLCAGSPCCERCTNAGIAMHMACCVSFSLMLILHHHHFWQAPLRVCSALNIDINLQNGRFWARSTVSSILRSLDFRSCWMVFIHVIRGRLSGLLQFPAGEAVKFCFASVSSGIRAMCSNRDRRLDWTMAERWGCLVNLLTSRCAHAGANWFLAAFSDTTDQLHRSCAHHS